VGATNVGAITEGVTTGNGGTVIEGVGVISRVTVACLTSVGEGVIDAVARTSGWQAARSALAARVISAR
jgi:hypothetical protein